MKKLREKEKTDTQEDADLKVTNASTGFSRKRVASQNTRALLNGQGVKLGQLRRCKRDKHKRPNRYSISSSTYSNQQLPPKNQTKLQPATSEQKLKPLPLGVHVTFITPARKRFLAVFSGIVSSKRNLIADAHSPNRRYQTSV
jgi:hypothetical protein